MQLCNLIKLKKVFEQNFEVSRISILASNIDLTFYCYNEELKKNTLYEHSLPEYYLKL